MQCRDYLFDLLETTDDVRTYLKTNYPSFSLLKAQKSDKKEEIKKEDISQVNPEIQAPTISTSAKLDESSLVIQEDQSSLDDSSIT